jgi:hypothetical protein
MEDRHGGMDIDRHGGMDIDRHGGMELCRLPRINYPTKKE